MSETDPNGHDQDQADTEPQMAEPAAEDADDEAASGVSELEEERDRLKDQLLRTAADYDNFRKRSRKDVDMAERRGREDVVRELLPVIDNLERAVMATGEAPDVNAIREGVEMVLRQFEDASQKLGLEKVSAVGERFDPALHDAIQQLPTDEYEPGTVVEQILPGYRLREKLLRPAMVVVARPKVDEEGG
ncbi:MAG: nucleotide exchange factor GrpE [Sandaracinaceae bacterium]